MFHASIAVFDRIYCFIIIIWIYFLYLYIIFLLFVFFALMWRATNVFFIHRIQIYKIFIFSFLIYYEFMNVDKVVLDSGWIKFLLILLILDSNRLIVNRFIFFSNENCQCIYEFWTIELKSRNELLCSLIIFLTSF